MGYQAGRVQKIRQISKNLKIEVNLLKRLKIFIKAQILFSENDKLDILKTRKITFFWKEQFYRFSYREESFGLKKLCVLF
jgi:hypothetical protein